MILLESKNIIGKVKDAMERKMMMVTKKTERSVSLLRPLAEDCQYPSPVLSIHVLLKMLNSTMYSPHLRYCNGVTYGQ